MIQQRETVELVVYGAKQICASCMNQPSSEETVSWLQAALSRDYGDTVHVSYIDVEEVPEAASESEQRFIEGIMQDEYAYPLIVLNGEVVAEGNPRLKVIRSKLEQLGIRRTSR